MQVPISLKSHPKLRRCLEQSRQTQCSIGRDAALAEHDLVQTVQRDPEATRGFDLADAHRFKEFFKEHFAWWNRGSQPVRIPSDNLRRGLRRHVPAPIEM